MSSELLPKTNTDERTPPVRECSCLKRERCRRHREVRAARDGTPARTALNFAEGMPVPVQGAYQRGPTCWDRVKMGFTIGFCVGMASGALFGGFSALRYGLRGRELIQSVGKVMLQGGGTFGTFMSIGTAIRC
uniref:Reactive oxygen species modulator 1 n=3 Tax=Amblyomma TaxID=6942 RepID=G3MMY7_AMBMU